jgi:hypothetical protein
MQNVDQTIISQYANSPVINAYIGSFNDAEDPSPLFDAFYANIWDIYSASGYGLDVWGRILGVTRVVQVAGTGDVLAFEEEGTSAPAQTFGFGAFGDFIGGTYNYELPDNEYILLLLAKAATNICGGAIPAINAILLLLFPGRGDCYVTDGLNMTMTYTFNFPLTAIELAIVEQSGVLPKPSGVGATVVVL